MNTAKLFEKIDELNEKYVGVWIDSCNIESPTDFKAGVDECGRYLARVADGFGCEIEVIKQDVAGDVYCFTINKDSPNRPITLSGHIDTVHPLGTFGVPAVRIEGDKIFGPGVTDCKGGVIAAIQAMEALKACGFTGRPVRLILQTDEETGSSTSGRATINYMCESSKDSVAFLNLESISSKNEACIERKGIANFTLTVHGREAHSANCATMGASAILEAAHKVIELEKLKDAEGLTCNCGVISGGSVPNTVPGECTVKANVRFATTEQLEWVKEHMQKIADTVYVSGCTTKVELSRLRVAMEYCERNQQLVDKINHILTSNKLPAITLFNGKGGSDAAEVTEAGIPCIDCFGTKGGAIHSPSEFGYLCSLPEAAKRIAAVCAEI